MAKEAPLRRVTWLGPTRRILQRFPLPVRRTVGFALYHAQKGAKHESAKPLRGFGGAGVLEVVEDYRGDTYRAIYTVRFTERIYVLHMFQKKAKRGIKTPKQDIDLIKQRLKEAETLQKAGGK